ncbi:transporter substrate-binding domain-containing protein [Paraburkholderia sp. MPAMCS5]|uniref:substrate-binding periplasmic protein n=1 Tax=Paraburkholderia sp. MPAMCS5 TaxID=3112563 RepID=UPI002E17FAE0|nr:transporter substrate-binding domain-containing protein [Paraburkholderia sp. MPAMCS5]
MKNVLRKFGCMAVVAGLLQLQSIAPAYAQAKTDLQSILDSKTVRVGAVEATPWYSKDLLTNKWVGIVPDIMEAMFEKKGIKVEYVDTQWGTAVAGLQSGRFDLLGAYNETPERAKAIDFSKPIGALHMAVLTFGDPKNYATWDQVNNPSVKLGAIDGAGATRLLQPILTKTTWVVNSTSDAMFLGLESNRADAIVTSDIQISQFIQKRHKGTMVIPTPLYSQPTNIGLRKSSDAALKQWLDNSLDQMRKDGSLDRIWSKYVVGAAGSK